MVHHLVDGLSLKVFNNFFKGFKLMIRSNRSSILVINILFFSFSLIFSKFDCYCTIKQNTIKSNTIFSITYNYYELKTLNELSKSQHINTLNLEYCLSSSNKIIWYDAYNRVSMDRKKFITFNFNPMR